MKLTPPMLGLAAVLAGLLVPHEGLAHCDTLNGPVVQTARAALAARQVTPALKWVRADQEMEVRSAFDHTLAVRSQSGAAADLADRYFFETLVRLHRAGEGEPYDGLKPAGAADPAIAAADEALESGNIAGAAASLADRVNRAVTAAFQEVLAKRVHEDDSVEAGRAYVAAYVRYIHLYERLAAAAEDLPAEGAPSHGLRDTGSRSESPKAPSAH